MCPRSTLSREGGGSGVRDMVSLSSLKRHSLILRPISRNSAVVICTQQFKTFDSNHFILSSTGPFIRGKIRRVSNKMRTVPFIREQIV